LGERNTGSIEVRGFDPRILHHKKGMAMLEIAKKLLEGKTVVKVEEESLHGIFHLYLSDGTAVRLRGGYRRDIDNQRAVVVEESPKPMGM
jgi:hypothetical protein